MGSAAETAEPRRERKIEMKSSSYILGHAVAACALGWVLWTSPAVAEPATVLLTQVEADSGSDGAIAQVIIEGFDTDAMVFATATGQAAYSGALGSAGIVVSIRQGGATIEDQSSEGQSLNMLYRSAVSHAFFLPGRRAPRSSPGPNPMAPNPQTTATSLGSPRSGRDRRRPPVRRAAGDLTPRPASTAAGCSSAGPFARSSRTGFRESRHGSPRFPGWSRTVRG